MPLRSKISASKAAVALVTATVCAGIAGCSSTHDKDTTSPDPSQGGSVQKITIHTNDQLRFSPMQLTVHTGRVQIMLENSGSYPHDMAIPSLHVKSASVSGDPGSQDAKLTVNFPKAGKYRFSCDYHSTAGMVGTITVK